MPRTVIVTGVRKVQARLQTGRMRCGRGVARGLQKAALYLLGESQKLVPVDTGALRASGQVAVEGKLLATTAYVFYGTSYATYVHEDLEAFHEPPTQAKYLEQPAREHNERLKQIIADECRRELG